MNLFDDFPDLIKIKIHVIQYKIKINEFHLSKPNIKGGNSDPVLEINESVESSERC